jgi:DNA-directed RNA polymerase subunit RPC12/RpoP
MRRRINETDRYSIYPAGRDIPPGFRVSLPGWQHKNNPGWDREEKMTWKCHDCESMFDDPNTVLYRGRRIGNGSENWEKEEYIYVCPVCGSDEIYEAYLCDYCEKEVGEGELDEDDLCSECAGFDID